MTDRLGEQGAVQYAQNNPTSAGVSRLGGAGALQAEIADALANGRSILNGSRLGGKGRIYALAAGAGPGFLFSAGQVGAWYDYSDSTDLFDNSYGSLAIAAGGSIGLALDNSQGLVIGSENVVNGGFDVDASWTKIGTVTISGSVLTLGSSSSVSQSSLAEASETFFKIIIDIASVTGGVIVYCGTNSSSNPRYATQFTTSGIKELILPSAGGALIQLGTPVGGSAVVNSVSFKKLSGYHATQATTGNQPLWNTAYAELDAFDDYLTAAAGGGGTTGFLFAAAIRPSGTGTARTLWSDTGTNTGYKVALDTSNQLVLSAGNGVAYTSATRIGALVDGTDYVVMCWHDGTNLNVSVNNGTATQQAFATATAGTAGFAIGRDNGAATSPFGARVYGIVYRKNDASTAAERTAVASYLAGKAGVTL